MEGRLSEAIARIDAYNTKDPNHEEYLYSQRMSDCLEQYEPDASEALQIAVRAQHIGRWTIPRESYPADRAGYKRWRTDLAAFHADKTGQILREAGYSEELIGRVGSLLRKEELKTDPECQILEDVACLVFLEHEFDDFAANHPDDKLVRILQRTWLKMSPKGRRAALKLDLSERALGLVERAIAQ